MASIIPVHRRMNVYRKTDFKCAICGSTKDLTCDHFIPKWTRIVGDEYENLIPMCDKCNEEKGVNFIELGKLKYLPKVFIDMLMRYYKPLNKYLKKYVKQYGAYRTEGKLDVEQAMLILNSYDMYIFGNKDLDWEDIE